MGYLWRPIRLQGNVFDYTKQSKQAKFDFIKNQSKSIHFKQPALFNSNCFFSLFNNARVILFYQNNLDNKHYVYFFKHRIERVFVPKFFYDGRDKNFLKHLAFVKKHPPRSKKLTELNIGRVQYEFSSSKVNLNADQQWKQEDNNDFPFPEKYYKNIGFTIHGFSFKFNNALVDNSKSILNPSDDLINDGENSNTELIDNNLTSDLFFEKQPFYKKCKNTKQFQQRILLMKVFFCTIRATQSKRLLSLP